MITCILLCAVSLGIYAPTYFDEDWVSNQEIGFDVRVGSTLHAWASFDKATDSMVGQRHSRVDMLGVGVGYQHRFDDRWYGILQAGYFLPDVSTTKESIRNEAVWRQLRNEHGEPIWHPEHTTYDLGKNWGGKIGAGAYLTDWLQLEGRFVWRSLPQSYDACTGPDPSCNYPVAPGERHWQNRRSRTAHAAEVSLRVEF